MAGQALSETIALFQQDLHLKPNDPQAFFNLGRALAEALRLDEAILCYRQALRLKPDFAGACKQLGEALQQRRVAPLDEAVSCFREAMRLNPDDAEACSLLGRALMGMGLLDEAIVAHRRACEFRPDSAAIHSKLLKCLHYHPDSSPKLLAEEHEAWNQRHAVPLASFVRPHANDRDPIRRLRIGYVSTCFFRHPVARFMLPLLAAHDRHNYEILCYSSGRIADGMTGQLRKHCDGWHDIARVSDNDLADLIRQDRIDILVDLDSHTPMNRLLAFARKPAPIQVTYLAYCSTTGLRTIDYRLTDPFLDPLGQPSFYAEESVWLPETYWCYQPHRKFSPVGPPPVLAGGHVTFGCLNNFCKASLPTLTVWRDLLTKVSGSRLLLHAAPGSHRDRVRKFFAEGNVDPERITFAGFSLPAQYFERYHQIDICLDPFPYGGGTTTCDALWMGVPVVSLAGKTAVGRVGLTILSNIGLPELAAQTPEEYGRIAAELADDKSRLASLRAGLRDRMLGSPLMDASRFARNVENAFRAMWQTWCRAARGC
jgi:predicted O-linked N-acetylglucosamine transferase (SPINDLY family)